MNDHEDIAEPSEAVDATSQLRDNAPGVLDGIVGRIVHDRQPAEEEIVGILRLFVGGSSTPRGSSTLDHIRDQLHERVNS